MGSKYQDMSIRWLHEKGFAVLADPHQYAYTQALLAPSSVVQSVWVNAKAGTGKTTLAALCGAYLVERGDYDKIIYIRNAVAVRDQGFLPGELAAKEAPFMQPIADAMEYVEQDGFEQWIAQGKLVTLTTSYLRGVNWKNAFIVVDEAQSWLLEELQTTLTRPHDNCKIVVVGSTRQVDGKVPRICGKLPFEVYMQHYHGQPAVFCKLEKNYRGDFANHADDVQQTVNAIKAAAAHG